MKRYTYSSIRGILFKTFFLYVKIFFRDSVSIYSLSPVSVSNCRKYGWIFKKTANLVSSRKNIFQSTCAPLIKFLIRHYAFKGPLTGDKPDGRSVDYHSRYGSD